MLPSREYNAVKDWLATYPHITVVSRDGSTTYRNAISASLPYAHQVSDRFHLIRNLTNYAKDYPKKKLSVRIRVALDDVDCVPEGNSPSKSYCTLDDTYLSLDYSGLSKSSKNRMLTLKEKYEQMVSLINQGYNKTAICKALNMDIRSYNRLLSAKQSELDATFTTSQSIIQKERLSLKISRVNEVRELKSQGTSLRGISRTTGLHFDTVRKYADENFNVAHASYGQKRAGNLTPFTKDIDIMLSQGLMGVTIESKIRDSGYKGSSSNLRKYISDWKKSKQPIYISKSDQRIPFETIERRNLFKLLYNKPEEVRDMTDKRLSKIFCQFPVFQEVYNLIWEFRKLLESKDSSSLQPWIEAARSLNIMEINRFIEGITRDISAVENAISLPYSNGIAEGKINKLKVIKRVMFGRCSFEMLRAKVLQLEDF